MLERITDEERELMSVRKLLDQAHAWNKHFMGLPYPPGDPQRMAAKAAVIAHISAASIAHKLDVMTLALDRIASSLEVLVGRGDILGKAVGNPDGEAPDKTGGDS